MFTRAASLFIVEVLVDNDLTVVQNFLLMTLEFLFFLPSSVTPLYAFYLVFVHGEEYVQL